MWIWTSFKIGILVGFANFLLLIIFISTYTYLGPGNHVKRGADKNWRELRKGEVAIITGSSGGIGKALVHEAVQLGMKVVLADIAPEESEKLAAKVNAEGGEAIVVRTDVTVEGDRKRLVDTAIKKFGKIDFLFNNAGRGYIETTEDMDLDLARKSFELNFWACMDLAKKVIPVMKKNGHGYIINMGSVVVRRPLVLPGDTGIYAAAKMALTGWTIVLQKELEPYNIKVRIAHPDGVKTKYFRDVTGTKGSEWRRIVMRNWKTFDEPEIVARDIFAQIPHDITQIYPGSAKRFAKNLADCVSDGLDSPLCIFSAN